MSRDWRLAIFFLVALLVGLVVVYFAARAAFSENAHARLLARRRRADRRYVRERPAIGG
jgi:hypothetical protein